MWPLFLYLCDITNNLTVIYEINGQVVPGICRGNVSQSVIICANHLVGHFRQSDG